VFEIIENVLEYFDTSEKEQKRSIQEYYDEEY
jgi:hypothetical protein